MVNHGYFSSSKNKKEVASILNAHMHSYAMANIRFDIPFTSDKFCPIHTSTTWIQADSKPENEKLPAPYVLRSSWHGEGTGPMLGTSVRTGPGAAGGKSSRRWSFESDSWEIGGLPSQTPWMQGRESKDMSFLGPYDSRGFLLGTGHQALASSI